MLVSAFFMLDLLGKEQLQGLLKPMESLLLTSLRAGSMPNGRQRALPVQRFQWQGLEGPRGFISSPGNGHAWIVQILHSPFSFSHFNSIFKPSNKCNNLHVWD